MNHILRIATFNIHKGVNSFNSRLILSEQREKIRHLHADIVFLQEVCGVNSKYKTISLNGQYEYLADSIWSEFAYGKNAVTSAGHHGNAILSKFPIVNWENENISANTAEQRGLLHCVIEVPNWTQPLHCICVHLGLFAKWRRQQLQVLSQRITRLVPKNAPLIIAGDFNDWGQKASGILAEQQHLVEVFKVRHGFYARSFPAFLPLLRLDRIYTRGFRIQDCHVHSGYSSAKLSDHAALSATIYPL